MESNKIRILAESLEHAAALRQNTTQHDQNQNVVNVQNYSINPRLQGVSAVHPNTSATQIMQQQPAQGLPQQLHASQVRGTAQPVPVTGQPRPPGKGNLSCITLPPGFKLPPGKIIVKNEQGQIMIVNAGAGRGTTGLSKVIHEKHAATPRNMIIRSGSSSASGAAATGTPNQRHAATATLSHSN